MNDIIEIIATCACAVVAGAAIAASAAWIIFS